MKHFYAILTLSILSLTGRAADEKASPANNPSLTTNSLHP